MLKHVQTMRLHTFSRPWLVLYEDTKKFWKLKAPTTIPLWLRPVRLHNASRYPCVEHQLKGRAHGCNERLVSCNARSIIISTSSINPPEQGAGLHPQDISTAEIQPKAKTRGEVSELRKVHTEHFFFSLNQVQNERTMGVLASKARILAISAGLISSFYSKNVRLPDFMPFANWCPTLASD